MHVMTRRVALVVALGVGVASPLSAQPAIAHLSQVEGTVTRLHRFVPAVASVGVVLVAGDQIVTAVGRAELTFVDGSVMHLDQHTQVAIAAAARIRLIDGRVSLRTTTAYTADTGTGIVHVLPEGIFELTANATNRDVLIQVVEGDARIESSRGIESIRSTQTAFVSGPTGHAFVSPSIQMQQDSFVQWSNLRYVAIVPPPTFLPYAHPTYRQFAYERSLRKVRFDRNRSDVTIRGERGLRGERRRDTSSARETSGERRRDGAAATSGREGRPARRGESPKQADRDDRPRTQPRPAARAWGAPGRGGAKGAAIRQP
jgi:hypothetical protein